MLAATLVVPVVLHCCVGTAITIAPNPVFATVSDAAAATTTTSADTTATTNSLALAATLGPSWCWWRWWACVGTGCGSSALVVLVVLAQAHN